MCPMEIGQHMGKIAPRNTRISPAGMGKVAKMVAEGQADQVNLFGKK